jgi:hypothetical protein
VREKAFLNKKQLPFLLNKEFQIPIHYHGGREGGGGPKSSTMQHISRIRDISKALF